MSPTSQPTRRTSGGRGPGAFPKVRVVSLVEAGTRVLFGTRMGPCTDSKSALARKVLPQLLPGMLCLADRGFFGRKTWRLACATGADQLWRLKKSQGMPCRRRLADGSRLSLFDDGEVRVIEYRLEGVEGAEPLYRLVTTAPSPEPAPARELAALYHERWEIETALDELKTHLRGARIVLRSKTPDLVEQEFYGLMLAHFAVRGLMHEAALRGDEDPGIRPLHSSRAHRKHLRPPVDLRDSSPPRRKRPAPAIGARVVPVRRTPHVHDSTQPDHRRRGGRNGAAGPESPVRRQALRAVPAGQAQQQLRRA